MSIGLEHAQEGMEHAHHEVEHAHGEHGTDEHGQAHELMHGHAAEHDPHHATHDPHHPNHDTMHNPERHPRQMAVVIAALAASLALIEVGEKNTGSDYITQHITVSDTYNFLQAKNIRAGVMITSADILDNLPGANDAARARALVIRGEAARLLDDPKGGEGRKQLLERAKAESAERDISSERNSVYEYGSGALQIAIVLISVSIVTKSRPLSYLGAAIGLFTSLYMLYFSKGWF